MNQDIASIVATDRVFDTWSSKLYAQVCDVAHPGTELPAVPVWRNVNLVFYFDLVVATQEET